MFQKMQLAGVSHLCSNASLFVEGPKFMASIMVNSPTNQPVIWQPSGGKGSYSISIVMQVAALLFYRYIFYKGYITIYRLQVQQKLVKYG